jgi:hypothetical protein
MEITHLLVGVTATECDIKFPWNKPEWCFHEYLVLD